MPRHYGHIDDHGSRPELSANPTEPRNSWIFLSGAGKQVTATPKVAQKGTWMRSTLPWPPNSSQGPDGGQTNAMP
jgi:hypothetical protein